jgi:PIN like domain
MRERFPGFYRPSDEQIDAFLNEGLICPDANILLTLYRVSEATRENVFSVFESLGERLWFPHQVVLEFQRNRRAVIREQEQVYDQLGKELQSFPGRLLGKVRRHHPRINRAEFETVVKSAVGEIESHLEELRALHPDPLESEDTLGADLVRDRLEQIVGERVGIALDQGDVERVGKDRYAKGAPPGYADAEKGGGRQYGDVAVWLELLAKAEQHDGPMVFVTDDAKEDWWLIDDGETIAPRHELVQEMRERSESDFWMYRFEPFLSIAAERLGISLGAAARAEVTDAQQSYVFEQLFGGQGHLQFPTPGGPPSGFPPSPARQRAFASLRSMVEIRDDSITLSLFDVGAFVGNRLTCTLSGPAGWIANAVVIPPGPTASVVFPADFGMGGVEEGPHQYEWLSNGPQDAGPGTVIAEGTFSV